MEKKLNIQITDGGGEVQKIPKRIQILNTNLDTVKDFWLHNSNEQEIELPPDVYVTLLTFPSGKELKQVANLRDALEGTVTFNLEGVGAHESHSWAHLSRKVINTSPEVNLINSKYLGAWIRLWTFEDNLWSIRELNISDSSEWSAEGVNYTFYIDRGLHYLQVGGPKIPWRLIALPPSHELKSLIKPNTGPTAITHPLEVVVSSPNWESETILTLLKNHDLDKAQKLFEGSYLNEVTAETLLQEKFDDPCAAAIGAYYLLRLEKFDRLHDWVENLANKMEWMPDGSIIWAWQLIKQGRQAGEVNTKEVKKRLMEAFHRGMPIYTEGFRLLWDGLRMINDTEPNDDSVKDAVRTVYNYVEALDWNSAVTTFNGTHPREPRVKSSKGTPRDKTHLAYIYDVPTKVLIDIPKTSSDNVLELRAGDFIEKFEISEKGNLTDTREEVYESIAQIRKKLDAFQNDSTLDFGNIEINLDDEIKQFRMGRKKL